MKNTICTLCLIWYHIESSFIFKIFIDQLYFDTLVIGLFQVCLFMGTVPGEVTLSKLLVSMLTESWVVSFAWRQVKILVKRYTCGRWGKRKLCMVPYDSYQIYGTWRSIYVGEFQSHHMRSSHKKIRSFSWGDLPFNTPCRCFPLTFRAAIDWVNQLKNGLRKGFISHTNIPAMYHFWHKKQLIKLK